jgi:hypothetical protein
MIAIEVFKKKKKMAPIMNKCWPIITSDMPYPPMAEQEPAQKLVYFGVITYATVFESATAAGMSSSAGHYLARMQLGKCALGEVVTEHVESTFSGFDTDAEQEYVDFFHSHIGQAIERIMADEGEIESLRQAMADHYKPIAGLGAEG